MHTGVKDWRPMRETFTIVLAAMSDCNNDTNKSSTQIFVTVTCKSGLVCRIAEKEL